MFDSIVLTRQNSLSSVKPLDIGSLVEKMYLYGKITVIADYPILEQIYCFFGGDNLRWLLNEEYLSIIYKEYPAGILSTKIEGQEVYSPLQFSSPQHCFQDELREICIDAKGKKGAGRRLARSLEKRIRVIQETPKILAGTTASILNPRYIESSARIIISELVPALELDESRHFNTSQTTNGIVVKTNYDFELMNKIYHKTVSPSYSTITPAYILTHLLELEESLFFAASSSSELSCSHLSSRLGINKVDYIIENSIQKNLKLNTFKEVVFGNVHAIREAVNAGAIPLDEILRVLKKSRKYKEWLLNKPADADLLQEYLRRAGEQSFIEKLPGKVLRYSVFSGIGCIAAKYLSPEAATVISLSLGAFDTFLLDKLYTGWNPRHYIDEQIKELVRQ